MQENKMNISRSANTVGRMFSTTAKCRKALRYVQRKGQICGQVTVEFALIMPLVCVMLLGVVECGWLINNEMTMANAVRETARSAALGNSTSAIGTEATNMTSPMTLVAFTKSYSTDNGSTWQTTWPPDSYATNNGVPTTNNGVPSGALIQISLAAYNKDLTKFIPQLHHLLLQQTTTMTRE
jgi:Flp pilus assembly protein TadG